MEILLRYILLYIIIIFGSIFISSKLKKKIDSSIIINFLCIIIILYIFGIFNLLNIGVWVISFLELILGSITIAKYIKNKQLHVLKENILTTGFIFFTIIYFVFAITTINKYLSNWDQFSYWSYAAKDMYYTNNLVITTSIGVQYPPMPTILEFFFMKVIGLYAQGIEAFAVQLLGFSLLLPLFEKIKNGKIAKISLSMKKMKN